MNIYNRINAALESIKKINRFRLLTSYGHLIDFSSNDYLGLAKNQLFTHPTTAVTMGSTGSRLITGHTELIAKLEHQIALFFEAEAALIFGNGYMANVGLLSCVANRNDIIIYDKFVHASIRDGIILCNSKNYSFEHNDCSDLIKKLTHAQAILQPESQIFVVLEAVYSMDGDSPLLAQCIEICKQFNAQIILDEAHSLGTVGEKGEGLAQSLHLHHHIFARIFTFGKSLGCEGAAIVGSENLKHYLINFCRTFIYTTAPSPLKIASINQQWNAFTALKHINNNADYLKNLFIQNLASNLSYSASEYGNIVMLMINDNDKAKEAALLLQNHGFDVRAILSPTVALHTERLRFCFHEFNTETQVLHLCEVINQYYAKN